MMRGILWMRRCLLLYASVHVEEPFSHVVSNKGTHMFHGAGAPAQAQRRMLGRAVGAVNRARAIETLSLRLLRMALGDPSQLSGRMMACAFHATPATQKGRHGGASALEKKYKTRRRKVPPKQTPQSPRQMREAKRAQEKEDRDQKALASMNLDEHLNPEFQDMIMDLLEPDAEPKTPEEMLRLIDPVRRQTNMTLQELKTGTLCSVDQYNRLIRAFGAHGRLGEAVKVFKDMIARGVAADPKSVTAVVWSASRAAKPEVAEEIMAEAKALGLQPDAWAWSALLHGYIRAGKYQEAMEAYKRMKATGFPDDIAACTSVLLALGRMKKREELMDFWIDMKFHNVEPDTAAYTAFMEAYASIGEVERTMSLYEEMQHFDVQPTIWTFNTMLYAASKAPLWFPGYNKYLVDIIGQLNSSCLAPNAHTYRALLRVCAAAGNPILAERYFAHMRVNGLEPTREHYRELLRAYAVGQSAGIKGGKVPKLLAVEGARNSAPGLAPIADGSDLREIRGRKGKKGRWIVPATRSQGTPIFFDPDADKRLEEAVQRGEVVKNALVVRDEVVEADDGKLPTVEGSIRGGMLSVLPPGEVERVKIDGLLPMEGLKPFDFVRDRLPGKLYTADLQEEYIRSATAVLQEMEANGIKPDLDTMNQFLSVYAEALRVSRTVDLLEVGFKERGLVPDQRTYFVIVRMLVRAKRLGRALEYINGLLDKGIKPSVDTLGMLMQGFGRKGELKPALYLLEMMALDLKYTPKEWHLRPLRTELRKRKLKHPLIPADPKEWLWRGLKERAKKNPASEKIAKEITCAMAGPKGWTVS